VNRLLTPSRVGWILVMAGTVGALISILADGVGLGKNVLMYGRYQFIGTALGLILIVLGASVLLMGRQQGQ
jgi:hypothetical protein